MEYINKDIKKNSIRLEDYERKTIEIQEEIKCIYEIYTTKISKISDKVDLNNDKINNLNNDKINNLNNDKLRNKELVNNASTINNNASTMNNNNASTINSNDENIIQHDHNQ